MGTLDSKSSAMARHKHDIDILVCGKLRYSNGWLLRGLRDKMAASAVRRLTRSGWAAIFGFGGIARVDEGQLPGRDVLAEHLRLGSGSVILSRTFHRGDAGDAFEAEVAKLRQAEAELAQRTPAQVDADTARIAGIIQRIAAGAAA